MNYQYKELGVNKYHPLGFGFDGAQPAESSADEEHLHASYGVFVSEARALNPSYRPETVNTGQYWSILVNTDEWKATKNTFSALFSTIVPILCSEQREWDQPVVEAVEKLCAHVEPRSDQQREYHSPAHRLNQKQYYAHWLHNLQVCASCQGFRRCT